MRANLPSASAASSCRRRNPTCTLRLPTRRRATQLKLSVAPELAAIVGAGALWLDGATVVDREPRLNAPLAAAEAAVRGAGAGAGGPAEITAVRSMYKRVGLDPTKTRPSSEALLRRVRKG